MAGLGLCTWAADFGLSELGSVPSTTGLAFLRGPYPLSCYPGPGAASAPCKPGRAAGGLMAGAESVRVCLHQGPLPAPLQVRTPAGTVWRWDRAGGTQMKSSQGLCHGSPPVSGSPGTPGPFPSAQQGTGPQASK